MLIACGWMWKIYKIASTYDDHEAAECVFIWASINWEKKRKKKKLQNKAQNTEMKKKKWEKKTMRKHISCCGNTRNEPFISFIVLLFFFLQNDSPLSTSYQRKLLHKKTETTTTTKNEDCIALTWQTHVMQVSGCHTHLDWMHQNSMFFFFSSFFSFSSIPMISPIRGTCEAQIWKGIRNKWM